MRLQILGTAAAEGWPAMFCACEPCRRARELGGKNIRSRASVMVNDNIKIDMNADTFHHVATHKLDLSRLEHILFTHSHNDHLSPGELNYLRDPFAHGRSADQINIWGSSDVIDVLREHHPDPARLGAVMSEVVPFKTIKLGDLSATPVIAVHKQDELCLNWLLGDLDQAVLYASDTGLYGDATWEFLSGVKLCLVISECTHGYVGSSASHMSIGTVLKMRETLANMGSLADDCPFVITHFSHNSGLLHDELSERAAADGLKVAYDGIVLETGQ